MNRNFSKQAKRAAAALILSWAGTFNAEAASSAPDLVLRSGHIWTGDDAVGWAEAVAISGDKISAVGPDTAITPMADEHTHVINLKGRTAMPGINDSHDHIGGAHYGVMALTQRPPNADPSLGEVVAAIREVVGAAPPGAWIHAVVGVSVMRNVGAARPAIDEAGGEHPVILEAWWGHGVILNAHGLSRMGLNDAVQDPLGGHYDRDHSGHLSGLLEEYAGNAVKRRLSTEAGVPAAIKEFREYAQHRLRQGVTSVQVMGTNARLIDLERTFVQADTPLRLRIMRYEDPAEDARLGDRMSRGEEVLSPRVRVAGVKWVLDGTPLEELAYQTKDYADRPGWHGRPNFSVEFVREQLRMALEGKDQLMMHIVGDAMTDEVLDEMEGLAPAERWRPLRVRFEHADGLVTPERMRRAKLLGIVVAQPRPGRPFRSLLAAGIPLAYGSDGGMAPFFMFARMTDSRDPQSISREQALAVLTRGSAYAEFQETKKGKLSPGMWADIAVLSQDVLTASPDKLTAIHSVLTIAGGKVMYSSASMD